MSMKKAKHQVDRTLEAVLITLMAADVVTVLWQVFTRFILRDPSSFTEELARFLLIWVGLLGAGYAAGQKLHLAVDVVLQSLSPRRRHQAGLLIQTLVFLFALAVMVIGGIRLVSVTLRLHQISAALRVKLGYVYLVLPLSGLLLMFYAAVFFREHIRALRGRPVEMKPERVRVFPD